MGNKHKILFICTGNSCRSQMAEGLLRSMAATRYDVFSAGTAPSIVHPLSKAVMNEIGIDISRQTSDPVGRFRSEGIDIIISLSDKGRRAAEDFAGDVQRIHWDVNDPFQGWDNDSSQLPVYRQTRDELKERIMEFIKG